MAKKKQPDFQPTKLRPGRLLPRGRNVTNTAFKSKPILMKRQLRKEKLISSIPDSLKQTDVGSSTGKVTALNHLNNLIMSKPDEFIQNLPDVINKVSKVVLDYDASVRKAAIDVLETICDLASDTQIQSFLPMLSCTLSCAMTHPNIKIVESSLKLLGIMLQTHPDLIIQSTDILKNLLNLFSNPSPRKATKSSRKRSLVATVSDSMQSQDWRIQVLQLMKMFFKAIIDNKKNDITEDDSENEIYWDCEGPLHLVIYRDSGLKPPDIEDINLSNLGSEISQFEHPENFQNFLSDIFSLLSAIYIEEIASYMTSSDDAMLAPGTVGNLNVIFQVISYLGEWVKLLSNPDNELDIFFGRLLNENIIKNLKKFPFLPRCSLFDPKTPKNQGAVQLNLLVCYLYSTFILQSSYCTPSFKRKIISYLKSVTDMNFEVRYESIPLLVNITKHYLALNDRSLIVDFIQAILTKMCSMLKVLDNSEHRKMMISLFIDMSLNPLYEFMNEDTTMKNWFWILFDELEKMVKSGIADRVLLREMKKIANRQHPLFSECLEEFDFNIIKDCLLSENHDIIDTAICLITHLEEITGDLLEDLSDIILNDESFPINMSFRLIRVLTSKLKGENTLSEDRVDFISFLLNIALDTLNVGDDKWANYDLPEFKEAYSPCKDITIFVVHPSLHWKKHSKLFEVCQACLNQFPKESVSKVVMFATKELLDINRALPIHSALAVLRLTSGGGYERYFECQLQDLIYSSLLFISVFTDVVTNEEWYQWNVVELMNSIELTRKTGADMLNVLKFESKVMREGIVLHYILRILKFFVSRNMLNAEDRDKVIPLLKGFLEHCEDRNFEQQPLFIKLFNFFYYDMC